MKQSICIKCGQKIFYDIVDGYWDSIVNDNYQTPFCHDNGNNLENLTDLTMHKPEETKV